MRSASAPSGAKKPGEKQQVKASRQQLGRGKPEAKGRGTAGVGVTVSRLAVVPHRPAASRPARQPKSLRPVGTLPPVRPLPVPRKVRQRQVARELASARRRPGRLAVRPRRRRMIALAPRPAEILRPERPPAPVTVLYTSQRPRGLARPAPISPVVRARMLAHAAQTVRYIAHDVVVEGRPAVFSTYFVWERGAPRTFSFVREERRSDLARIVRVDEATRHVTVLVPATGAVIQVAVPLEEVVTYSRALQGNPPSPDLVARADAFLHPGQGPVLPPRPPVALTPPLERVAGMREFVGQVKRVDPAKRRVWLAGSRGKKPLRVAEGVELPRVGEVVSIATQPDGQVWTRPVTGFTPLQPTIAGVVARVRPTAVELSVRAMTPEGQVEEVPVPVTENARVFISGQPGDLRALKEGIYIRAFMTPTGETRILGYPSEPQQASR